MNQTQKWKKIAENRLLLWEQEKERSNSRLELLDKLANVIPCPVWDSLVDNETELMDEIRDVLENKGD